MLYPLTSLRISLQMKQMKNEKENKVALLFAYKLCRSKGKIVVS